MSISEIKSTSQQVQIQDIRCYFCNKTVAKVYDCASCFMMRYCGKDCQTKDWSNHKKTCKNINQQIYATRAKLLKRSSLRDPTVKFNWRVSQILQEQFDKNIEEKKVAVDLGCGGGASTIFLLERGWHVIAIDNSQELLNYIESEANKINKTSQLTLLNHDLTQPLDLSEKVDLVLAIDTLPYIDPVKLYQIFSRAVAHMTKESYFIGSLFIYDIQQHEFQLSQWYHSWWIKEENDVNKILSSVPKLTPELVRRRKKDYVSSVVDFLAKYTSNQN